MTCGACLGDPELPKAWGCEQPTQAAVWVDEEHEFYGCPIRFISQAASEWYVEYAYYRELGGAPPFGDQDARFIEAIREYNAHYMRFSREKATRGQRDRTGETLATLRARHGGKSPGNDTSE